MTAKYIMPTEAHAAYMDDLKEVMLKHADMPLVELLAIGAQYVGLLIAAQDQTKFTGASVMALVASNIQIGNHAAVEKLLGAANSNGVH